MLKGKTALVTASTSGIGLGIAKALAVFLCSDAAKQVRGAAWNVDGGWAAQ
jgi:NAD(P)-dependent dehydrogenase (short-subunit alcohol dehydrogenase family)